jgi:hypothetical protein
LTNEKQLKDYKEAEALSKMRRLNIVDFVSIRDRMLWSGTPSDTSTSTESVETLPAKNTDPETDRPSSDKETLEDVVEDISKFVEFNASDHMLSFDDFVMTRVGRSLDPSIVGRLKYQLVGSTDDIALSLGDTGFAEVKLVRPDPPWIALWSGHLRFEFAIQSEKILSVRWTTVHDFAPVEQLASHVSHPSTVSLDKSREYGEPGTIL